MGTSMKRTTVTLFRRLVLLTVSSVAAIVGALVTPAAAQQLVDAGKQGDGSGGLAFVLMAVMVFGIGFALFFMDRVRRRRLEDERADR